MSLRADVIKQSDLRGLDPFTQPFKPSDLGLVSSDYGSFSDHCADTQSSKYSSDVTLKVAQWSNAGKPLRYLLIR
jgi:hypothetical protein